MTDTKCFAYVGQLVQLAGQKCHVLGCGEDIDMSVHTNCGYGVKLSWTCKKQHRCGGGNLTKEEEGLTPSKLIN